jgi:putative phage-type endonuclease
MRATNAREEWLKERMRGIGASEASAVIGRNPYMTNIELWQQKTGRGVPDDISGKPYVVYGTKAEAPLRKLFALDFPGYKTEYKNFDLVRSSEHPFLFATLDGRLTERETGRKGALEIKTTEIMRSQHKEQWRDRIPDNYYIQVLHQLIATGFEFAILKAQLKFRFGEDVYLQIRHYKIERSDVLEDLEHLKAREVKFWKENVMKDKRPDLILPEI